ncbi:hypothetical protein L208DRAFT_1413516, partial [Tricholoma matsutake]
HGPTVPLACCVALSLPSSWSSHCLLVPHLSGDPIGPPPPTTLGSSSSTPLSSSSAVLVST